MAQHEWGVMAAFRLDGAPHAMKIARAVASQERGDGDKLDIPLLLDATRLRFVSAPGCIRCGTVFDKDKIDERCDGTRGSDTPVS